MFESNEPQFAILVSYMLKVSTDLFTKAMDKVCFIYFNRIILQIYHTLIRDIGFCNTNYTETLYENYTI